MKRLFAVAIFWLFSMGNVYSQNSLDGDVRAVINALETQQSFWNKGDIEGFMKGYWQNDSLLFVSKKGLTYGWDNVLENYKKAYPNKAEMGNLEFEVKQINSLSNSTILLVGSWELTYPSQSNELKQNRPILGGHFSLLWKKTLSGWRIIVDHTS